MLQAIVSSTAHLNIIDAGGGSVDLVQSTSLREGLCSAFRIRARAPRQGVWSGTNNICIQIKEDKIKDVNGHTLPGATVCSTYDDK